MLPAPQPENLNHYLIGFDARENWLPTEACWSDIRKGRYLIKDVPGKPWSADENVWSPIFERGGCFYWPDVTDDDLVDVPDYVGINQVLWDDLDRMRGYLREKWSSARSYCVIALTAVVDYVQHTNRECWPYLGNTTPASIDSRWSFAGYDILTDQSLLSGLMNCDYDVSEQLEAAERWGDCLNEHHLFTDLEAARECRDWTSARVREHAPCMLCGLFLVEVVNG